MCVDTIEWLTRHRTTIGGADRWRLHYFETTHVQSPAHLLNTMSKKEAAEPASLTSCCSLIKPTITSWSQAVGPLQPRQAQLSIKAFSGLGPAAVCPYRGSQPGGRGTFIPSAFGTQEEELLPVCCQWEPIPRWRKMMG